MDKIVEFDESKSLKRCSHCKILKSKSSFHKYKRNKDGLNYYCKICQRQATKLSRNKPIGKIKAKANNIKYRKTAKGKAMRHREWLKYKKSLSAYLHQVVSNIKRRCYNKKARDYKWYGAKGIILYFTTPELKQWVLENNIYPRGKHIHRINPNEHYTLTNIEFLNPLKHKEKHGQYKPNNNK